MPKKTMPFSTIIVIEPDTTRRLNLSKVLKNQGLALVACDNAETAKAEIQRHGSVLVFIHKNLVEKKFLDWLSQQNAQLVVVSPSEITKDIDLFEPPLNQNQIIFYDRNNQVLTDKLILTTAMKFTKNDYFGLSKYLNPRVIRRVDIDPTIHRNTYLDNLQEFIKTIDIHSPFISSKAGLICEELLSNAVYLSKDESSLTRHGSRIKAPILTYGFEDGIFGLSVTDFYGTLELSLIVRYLKKCFTDAKVSLSQNPLRGGLGFFEIVSSCDSFIVNASPGVKTELITLIDTKSPQKSLKNLYGFQFFTST